MAENSVIISSEEEAKLLKPIDEYVEEIQKKIDALRADGFDKVSDLEKNRSRSQKKTRTYPQHREIRSLKTDKKELENDKKSRGRQQRRN